MGLGGCGGGGAQNRTVACSGEGGHNQKQAGQWETEGAFHAGGKGSGLVPRLEFVICGGGAGGGFNGRRRASVRATPRPCAHHPPTHPQHHRATSAAHQGAPRAPVCRQTSVTGPEANPPGAPNSCHRASAPPKRSATPLNAQLPAFVPGALRRKAMSGRSRLSMARDASPWRAVLPTTRAPRGAQAGGKPGAGGVADCTHTMPRPRGVSDTT